MRLAECGTPVVDVSPQIGIGEATFYLWRKKYGWRCRCCGIVKEVRPGMVTYPIVRLITDAAGECLFGREIDLAKMPGITIVSTAFDPWATAVASASS